MAKFLRRLSLLLLLLPSCYFARAQAARFDLAGPKVDIRVTRAGKTLPIAYVPNFQPGDKIWLHPDLPPTQSVHYLLICAFLRGTTNPPPDSWFTKIETWNRSVTEEGVSVVVPDEAQQVILFLAPETGGDFTTLKKAVRGRPGIFVRASQDLAEAGFEQARIEKYVASMRKVPPSDAKALVDHSTLLARTLNLKPNDDCFKRSVDLQYNCLTQSGNQTLLDDGHAQSVIASLANGPNSDFITAASYTGMAGGGSYSAYVGAVVDLFRILGGLHSAQYQYIPAISFPQKEALNLRLNTPPSFRNPKSVIVIGLPSVQKAVPPPLRPSDPNLVTCLLKPKVVLPLEGAPLVFSTGYAHDLVLHLNTKATAADIPLVPDAYQGGLIINQNPDRKPLPTPAETEAAQAQAEETKKDAPKPDVQQTAPGAPTITGTVSGSWGFDSFIGPTVPLQNVPGAHWRLASDDPLIAGHENHVLLASNGNACVESVSLESSPGNSTDIKWKAAEHANIVELNLALKEEDPGKLKIAVHQFGADSPAIVGAKTFAEPATLTALEFHAGDTSLSATGKNLFQVQQISMADVTFTPISLADGATRTSGSLELALPASAAAPKLKVGEKISASIALKDGRSIVLPVTVGPARPNVTLLSRNMGRPADSVLRLGNEDDLPTTQKITFSLKSSSAFPRTGKIEIANADETLHTELSLVAGTLVLQNPHTILATFDAFKSFGTSAFGPLRLRAIIPDGTSDGLPGAWLPLATLVRLPTLTNLLCPAEASAPCTLTGNDLYLIDSVASDEAFTAPTPVPEGFVASALSVPRPAGLPTTLSASRPATTTLYVRLRDDATSKNSAVIPVLSTAPASSPEPTQVHKQKDAQPKPDVSVSQR
ncbi:hypothetical protein BH10ACI4_BH10ACI4_13370 [soil metagenome]